MRRGPRCCVAILAFAAKLETAGPDAVGFLYYSGHGIASAGENYLIPIDIEEPTTVELSVQGVQRSEVLAILRGEAPNAAHYLVLDACRNDLQVRAVERVRPGRATKRRAGGFRDRARKDRRRTYGPRQRSVCGGAGHRVGEARAKRSAHVPQRTCRRNPQDGWRSGTLDRRRYPATTSSDVWRGCPARANQHRSPQRVSCASVKPLKPGIEQRSHRPDLCPETVFSVAWPDRYYGDLARVRLTN